MKHANDETFKEVVASDKLILLDFYATWCMPCKMQAEVLEKMDSSRIGECEIVKINVDEAPEVSNEFEISSIPTLILIKNGKILRKTVGFSDEKEIVNMINDANA